MNDKFNQAIEKKEKLIAESEAKITEYREKIKKLKNDIRVLKQKKKEAYGKKFLEMCEKRNLDFENETLDQLFANANVKPPGTEKNPHKEENTETSHMDNQLQTSTLEMI